MSQQPLFGFFLALTAAMMWGALPIALQPVLKVVDAQTIVWFRFVVAMGGMFIWLLFAEKLPKLTACRKQWRWLLLGIIGLAGNFFLFNLSLNYIPATASQVLSPISSFSMLLAGIVIFKERLGIHHKLGIFLLISGLLMYFNDKFDDFLAANHFALGIAIGLSASFVWVLYGLAQKCLSATLSAQQTLLLIYAGCTLLMTPFASPSQTAALSPFALGCLIFCCLNTVIAYGCYGEALSRWEVSKVSMLMPQIPILTLIFAQLAHWQFPDQFPPTELNGLSYLGAVVVVSGALCAAVGHKLFYRRQLKRN